MSPNTKTQSPSTQPVFLRDRLDAYWTALELHMLLLAWIPAQRGLGAARQRIDRALSRAVLAVGKATLGQTERWLDKARDALDTVLIALDDLTAIGRVSLPVRDQARDAILQLMMRLIELGELPLEEWVATSQPVAEPPIPEGDAAAETAAIGAERGPGRAALIKVLRRRELEAAAMRRAPEAAPPSVAAESVTPPA